MYTLLFRETKYKYKLKRRTSFFRGPFTLLLSLSFIHKTREREVGKKEARRFNLSIIY